MAEIAFRFEHFDHTALVNLINHGVEKIGPVSYISPFAPTDSSTSGTFGFLISFKCVVPGIEINEGDWLPGVINILFELGGHRQ